MISSLCCTTACTLEKSITNSFESVHTVPVHDSSDPSHGTTEQTRLAETGTSIPEQTDDMTHTVLPSGYARNTSGHARQGIPHPNTEISHEFGIRYTLSLLVL